MTPNSGHIQSSPASGTSTSLLQHVREGDSRSWQIFVQFYSPLVLYWAKQAGASQSDVVDIAQQVFQSVAQNLIAFRPESTNGSFRAWLRTITRNKTRDSHRRNQNLPQAEGGTEALRMLNATPAAEFESSVELQIELRIAAREALKLIESEFSPSANRIFLQLVLEERPAADVAAAEKLSIGAVYMTKSRILKRLREFLRENLGWEEPESC